MDTNDSQLYNSELSPKEQFDAYMKQAEFFTQRVYNRQAYQWKLSLGLWTLLALATAFLYEKHVTIPCCFGIIVILGFSFFWLQPVAIRNRNDHNFAFHFQKQAHRILAGDLKIVESRPRESSDQFEFLKSWAHVFELVTTGALLFGALWILHRSHCP